LGQVLHLGHGNGTVSLWSPNTSKPLVAFLTHTGDPCVAAAPRAANPLCAPPLLTRAPAVVGPVSAIAVDRAGQTMVTAGFDGYVKCWDIRTYKMLHAYTTFRPAEGLDISQLGLLGVGQGPHVQIWRDAVTNKARSPYMSHELPGHQVSDVRFCPYEDVLGVAHSDGFSSCVVPGAGAPNFDTFEENPFQTKKQRGEAEVRSLLEKLPADLISLDPDFVGQVTLAPRARLATRRGGSAELRRVQVRDHTSKVERNRAVRKPTEVLKDAAVGADGYNADAAAEETSDKAVKPRDRHRKRGRR
jgi:U3 small nucleolar RNA-associated protein 7